MTTVLVSKQRIINAIKKEKLKAGYWLASKEMIQSAENYEGSSKFDDIGRKTPIAQKDCMVCAVGAVFRSVCAKNSMIFDIDRHITGQDIEPYIYGAVSEAHAISRAQMLIDDEKYMSALSSYFEWLDENTNHKPYRIKEKLIKFVKDNFPKNIELDINGIQPAKDVKVLR